MRSLKEYMTEGLLDRVKNKEVNHDALIKEFLEANYDIRGSYVIKASNKGPVVDVEGYAGVENTNITSLTNGLFEFGVVSGDFNCAVCKSLKSLEGAPKKIGGWFDCSYCKSLKTLEGAPKEVGDFFCYDCRSLKTLEGAPKEVKGSFDCRECDSLKTLEGAPQKVGGGFDCSYCKSLTSLIGCPKEVEEYFHCHGCGVKFTEEDVGKHIKVVKNIYI